MRTKLILFLILGMLVLPACQQDAGDASEDYTAEMKKAEQGDASSQFDLGVRYMFGIPQDYKQAIRWFQAAAEQGHLEAQYELGSMYYRGIGVPQNYKQAARWLRAAADQGHTGAQNHLGGMYYNGDGVPQDKKEAARWWRAAAQQGDISAQSNLAGLYEYGDGVPQDYIQAHMWYNLAASSSVDDLTYGENRDSIAEKMTSEQIAEAQRLAREWKPKTGSQ